MKIEEVLLDTPSQTKLAIFSFLSKHADQKVRYQDIQSALGLSRLTCNLLLSEMDADFKELFDQPLRSENKVITAIPASFSFNRYFRFLIHKGLPYQFVLASLLYPTEELPEFMEKHYVSRSTLIRSLQNLKVYLEIYQLKMNFSQVRLLGSEVNLRFVYLEVLWLGSLGEDLFSEPMIDLTETTRLIKMIVPAYFANVQPNLLMLHLLIAKLRIQQGYYLAKAVGCELIYPDLTPLFTQYFAQFTAKPEQVSYQINAFKYQFVFAFYYSSNRDVRLPALKAFYTRLQQFDPVFVAFFEAFLCDIKGHLLQDQTDFLLKDQANLFSILYMHHLAEGIFPMFLGFDSYSALTSHPDFLFVKNQLLHFFKPYLRRSDFQWLRHSQQALASTLAFLVYPYYQKKLDRKVHVGITPVFHYLATQRITNFLDQLQFVDYMVALEYPADVDLILSNFHENVPPTDKPVFLFQINEDVSDFPELFQALWQLHEVKNTADFT